MNMILAIASGGAIGSVLRYLAGQGTLAAFGAGFPYGTLLVNVLGSFVMGAFVAGFAHIGNPSQEMRAFLTIGLLGGFTTFSSFSLDVITLYERGEMLPVFVYITASLVLSLAAIFTGMFLVRSFVS